jgi:hypothetical protein
MLDFARSASAGREFPILGSSRHPVSQGTRSRYFVTGPYTRTPGWTSARLIGSAHAKEVGTNVTVCGLPTASWSTLWEVPFTLSNLRGACPECIEFIRSHT